jgi:hypothetical protein
MSDLLEAFKKGTIFWILIKLEWAEPEAHQKHHNWSTQGRVLEKDKKISIYRVFRWHCSSSC